MTYLAIFLLPLSAGSARNEPKAGTSGTVNSLNSPYVLNLILIHSHPKDNNDGSFT